MRRQKIGWLVGTKRTRELWRRRVLRCDWPIFQRNWCREIGPTRSRKAFSFVLVDRWNSRSIGRVRNFINILLLICCLGILKQSMHPALHSNTVQILFMLWKFAPNPIWNMEAMEKQPMILRNSCIWILKMVKPAICWPKSKSRKYFTIQVMLINKLVWFATLSDSCCNKVIDLAYDVNCFCDGFGVIDVNEMFGRKNCFLVNLVVGRKEFFEWFVWKGLIYWIGLFVWDKVYWFLNLILRVFLNVANLNDFF